MPSEAGYFGGFALISDARRLVACCDSMPFIAGRE
jgi:hypothetical protein